MAKRARVDLILTDLLMPRCDGVETILGIRKAHPQMKILAMSGSLNQRHYLDLASNWAPMRSRQAIQADAAARGDHAVVVLILAPDGGARRGTSRPTPAKPSL